MEPAYTDVCLEDTKCVYLFMNYSKSSVYIQIKQYLIKGEFAASHKFKQM